jgi:hypothetical protein
MEHMKEKENKIAENNDVIHQPQFDDNDNHFVPRSPFVFQQQSQSIAADCPRRNIAPRKRLIEECSIVHYAMSCDEQVENDSKTGPHTEVIASVDRGK